MTTETAGTSDELVSLLVAEVQDYAILTLDVNGRVASWNHGARRIKGYEVDEILGQHFSTFYPQEAVAAGRPEDLLAAARREGRVGEEGWRVRKDGSRFWASVVITALHDETGQLRGYGKVTRDLTERHTAELALRAAEARFRAAFVHAPIGISITGLDGDERGRFVEINPAFARMLGYEPGELARTEISAVTEPEDLEAGAVAITELRDGRTVSFETRYRHRDGREVWTLVSSTPLPGEDRARGRLAITQVVDISERKRFESQLRHLADHDALTGLYNRHRFETELDRVTGEARRYGRNSALLILDLDGFKFINDSFGHPVGDELVTRIGSLITATVRATDIVARLGGDEFAVIMPQAKLEDAERLADRILQAIRERGHVSQEARHARVTTSVGITTIEGGTDLSGAELIVEADIAMYEAKEQGRDRSASYNRSEPTRATISLRQSWLERLRAAIESDRFVLHAQPVIAVCGPPRPWFELLLRLPDDNGELIPPGAFLYNAERFNLMGEIDRWVLRQAVHTLEAHAAAGNDVVLSVNLSGTTMNDRELAPDLGELLAAHPIPDGRLVIEVTETAAIVNIDRARAMAADLRALGCRFALDDFGSGFASFYYLKYLDFDYLKIDGEFVKHLTDTPTDRLVVQAVVDIARGLGTETVAEFVGNDETVELLRTIGVDFGQGFHLGVPGPVESVLPSLTD